MSLDKLVVELKPNILIVPDDVFHIMYGEADYGGKGHYIELNSFGEFEDKDRGGRLIRMNTWELARDLNDRAGVPHDDALTYARMRLASGNAIIPRKHMHDKEVLGYFAMLLLADRLPKEERELFKQAWFQLHYSFNADCRDRDVQVLDFPGYRLFAGISFPDAGITFLDAEPMNRKFATKVSETLKKIKPDTYQALADLKKAAEEYIK